jgi:putative transposase
VISHAVWLYFRFPLDLRMVEKMLADQGVEVSHGIVRQRALKFGQGFANRIRRRLLALGDKWHLDEAVMSIAGREHWLRRAVDQHGMVLDILVQSRRPAQALKHLLRKLLKKQGIAPRLMITDTLASYAAAKRVEIPVVGHRQHKGLKQSRGQRPSVSATARAEHEALQIRRVGLRFPFDSRSSSDPPAVLTPAPPIIVSPELRPS